MKSLSFVFFLSLLSFATFSQVKTNFTQQDYDKFFIEDCIPKDLKSEGHILMVKTPFKENEEKENEEIKTIFETYYKDKFVIAPAESK